MKKINRIYFSVWDVFGFAKKAEGAPTGYTEDGYHYHDGATAERFIVTSGEGGYYEIYPKHQFLGALYHFAKMGKALREAFKPYQSYGKVKRDLLQPVNGLINIAAGIVIIALSLLAAALWTAVLPLALLFSVCLLSLCLFGIIAPFFAKVIYPISWFIEGLATLIRGVAEVVCTPLAYGFELPFRGAMTLSSSNEYAEDKPQIQRLVIEAEAKIRSLPDVSDVKPLGGVFWDQVNTKEREAASLLFEIQRKFSKSINDGWSTRHNSSATELNVVRYCRFFPSFKEAAEKPYQMRSETVYPPKITEHSRNEALEYLEFFRKPLQDAEETAALLSMGSSSLHSH